MFRIVGGNGRMWYVKSRKSFLALNWDMRQLVWKYKKASEVWIRTVGLGSGKCHGLLWVLGCGFGQDVDLGKRIEDFCGWICEVKFGLRLDLDWGLRIVGFYGWSLKCDRLTEASLSEVRGSADVPATMICIIPISNDLRQEFTFISCWLHRTVLCPLSFFTFPPAFSDISLFNRS